MTKGPDFVCTKNYLVVLHHHNCNSVYQQKFDVDTAEEAVHQMQQVIEMSATDEVPDYLDVYDWCGEPQGTWRFRYGHWMKDGPTPPRCASLLNWLSNKLYGWSKRLHYRANVCICPPMCHDECCNICVRNPFL